ncbi:MAG: BrnT family toxin [Chloroflexi bacterium]|nr:BrnT family toxin [Chloroflexota bacterium]
MRFEWDPDKAQRNQDRHQVTFEEAIAAFSDPNAADDYDVTHSTSETRYNLIGMSSRRLLFIVYSEPQPNVVRIISARKAERKHQRIYAQEE